MSHEYVTHEQLMAAREIAEAKQTALDNRQLQAQLRQLRADLATVTAERDDYRNWNSEGRSELAETRKALEMLRANYASQTVADLSLRRELAKAEARVKEAVALLDDQVVPREPNERCRVALEALRG